MPRNPRQDKEREDERNSAISKLDEAMKHVNSLIQLRQQISEQRSRWANGVPDGLFDQPDVEWLDEEIQQYAAHTLQQTLQLAPLLSAEIIITVDGQQVQPA